jgi:hypothetical protein
MKKFVSSFTAAGQVFCNYTPRKVMLINNIGANIIVPAALGRCLLKYEIRGSFDNLKLIQSSSVHTCQEIQNV